MNNDDQEVKAVTEVAKTTGKVLDTCSFPDAVIFPLGQIEFEESAYPCPARVKEYLEIQYGYIGKCAIWDPGTDRWIKG